MEHHRPEPVRKQEPRTLNGLVVISAVVAGFLGVAMLASRSSATGHVPLLAHPYNTEFRIIALVAFTVVQFLAPGFVPRRPPESSAQGWRSQRVFGWTLLCSALVAVAVASSVSGTVHDIDDYSNSIGLSFPEMSLACWPVIASAASTILCGYVLGPSFWARLVPIAVLLLSIWIQRGFW